MDLSRHLPSEDEEEEKAETTSVGLSIRTGPPPLHPPITPLPNTGVPPIQYDHDAFLQEMVDYHFPDPQEVVTGRDDDEDSLVNIKVAYVKSAEEV